ncbi:PhaM family polyhydroxyalkanoate granule multifunctional regulatory protein [Massilia genomosp. 1]|nr:PhaM family polyhydroxyalkanoate granule multifunctional regulatory protein [Massilia genomosp. 1]
MLKPPMPNIPGVGAVTDTLDFVKNLWGSMAVPGMSFPNMAMPPVSLDELDKKIADLKAVEAWLNINVSMLRGTIQTMEVQRGTIATLKSMGATLAAAVKQPGADEKSVLAAAPFASAFFSQPAPAPAKAPEPVKQQETPPVNAMNNPVAWWNMLQEQFNQAVTTAMTPEAGAGKAGQAEDAGGKAAPQGASEGATNANPAEPESAAKAASRRAKPKSDA